MSTQIQLRRDTKANWEAINPILGDGEVVLVTDTNELVVGDGVRHFINCPTLNNSGDKINGINYPSDYLFHIPFQGDANVLPSGTANISDTNVYYYGTMLNGELGIANTSGGYPTIDFSKSFTPTPASSYTMILSCNILNISSFYVWTKLNDADGNMVDIRLNAGSLSSGNSLFTYYLYYSEFTEISDQKEYYIMINQPGSQYIRYYLINKTDGKIEFVYYYLLKSDCAQPVTSTFILNNAIINNVYFYTYSITYNDLKQLFY